MNEKLKTAKENLKEIEQYCKSTDGPIPTNEEVACFIKENYSDEYQDYAKHLINAVWAKEFILHVNRKSRR